jgi:hypothetical protein
VTPTTGQLGTSANFNCGQSGATVEPGNSANSQAGFNETTPGHAGTVYAGSGSGSANANSMAAVSQYDAACRALTNGGIGRH